MIDKWRRLVSCTEDFQAAFLALATSIRFCTKSLLDGTSRLVVIKSRLKGDNFVPGCWEFHRTKHRNGKHEVFIGMRKDPTECKLASKKKKDVHFDRATGLGAEFGFSTIVTECIHPIMQGIKPVVQRYFGFRAFLSRFGNLRPMQRPSLGCQQSILYLYNDISLRCRVTPVCCDQCDPRIFWNFLLYRY